MKRHAQAIQLLALLALEAKAQSTTVVSNPSDTGIVTSYYTTCPSVTSTTITLPGTTTICVGGNCPSYPVITAEPTPITIIGPDGRETIYNIETTILPALCPGGVCGATYTLSEQCPCTGGSKTITIDIDSCPNGFTTTAVACNACASNGGPATVTLTTPISTGPYASQTPAMGPPANNPAAITGTPAAPAAAAGANSASPANAGTGSGLASNAAASSSGGAVNSVAASSGTPTPNNNTSPITPIITPFQGSASRIAMAGSVSIAVFLGGLAILL